MVFKELEIQGFKSFPDKVKISFDTGVTGVVGPNGSGKSNLSDAVRWVLGETSSRQLRAAGKMEDVIFGGTRKRSPMGFAQVRLTLDNAAHTLDVDADEVTIGRKYYRSGDSEYTINGQVCRLRDVYELLLDTGIGRDGYSVIGQGRIAEIVAAKSSERREIFEEAAGISRYRYRKEESERKLARTEENLLRINDKVDELELQVEPLRKQAETAKKYLRLRDELKSAEVSVWMETLDRLHAQAETVNRDYQTAKENLAGAQRELEQLYAVSENIAQKMREKDLESERTREQISEAESAAAECESAAAVVRTNLQNSADSIARLRVEVSEQTDRADALQAQIDAQQRRLQEIEAEKAQHAQEIQSVLAEIDRNAASSGEAERAYTELLAKESAQSSALAECRTRITLLADKSQELLDQENAVATAAAEAAVVTRDSVSVEEMFSVSSALERALPLVYQRGALLHPAGQGVGIAAATFGRVEDYQIKDINNMGAAMAPAAWNTIRQNFEDFGVDASYYDRIITGDLGAVGQKALLDFMKSSGYDITGKHMDCGLEIYDRGEQDVHSGGSGCGCSAVTLCARILPKLMRGEWSRVLFVPTGALLSTVSYNEGQSIPGIAHAVILERMEV